MEPRHAGFDLVRRDHAVFPTAQVESHELVGFAYHLFGRSQVYEPDPVASSLQAGHRMVFDKAARSGDYHARTGSLHLSDAHNY